MLPGKASPIVFGGKIHTPRDVPERVYPEPLREALLVLDYVFFILEEGQRLREPRRLDEFHYARLYEVSKPAGGAQEYWLALKDALEPNRRNLNAVYRVEARVEEASKKTSVRLLEPLGWGVDTRLREDVVELCRARDKLCRRVRLDRLTVSDGQRAFDFGRQLTLLDELRRWGLRALAWVEQQMGRHSFITFFLLAYLIAKTAGWVLEAAFARSFVFQSWFFQYGWITVPLVLLLQIGALVYLMARRVPTWIDNHYRHENRADNMGSLRRVRARAVA
jgi:hypothetical protein